MIRSVGKFLVCVAVTISTCTTLLAQTGNPDEGKLKASTCVACHGGDGNSPVDQFPKIAGQVPGYIAQELARYKSQHRDNAIMYGMTISLSDDDMADLDAYYSSQEISVAVLSMDQEQDARAGEAIYRGGQAQFDIPACMACHGPSGGGIPPHYPRLGGQHAAYIQAQLLAFKSGTQKSEIMQSVAFPLSEKQIEQLAIYISALH